MSISVCSALKERIVATVMSLSGMNGYSFHGMSHSHLEGYAQEFHTMAPINLLARFTRDDLLDDTDFSSPKLRHAAGHEKRESNCQATFMNLMVLRAILLHAAEFTPGERRVLVLNVSVVLAFSGFESIALVLRQVMQILERQHNVRVPSLDE